MKCQHPDHNDNETCEDRTISCHKDCTCCTGKPCEHKHVTKTSGHGTDPEWVAVCIDCGAPLGKKYDEYYALPEKPIKTDFGPNGPQPGTAAYTAFLMAQLYPTNEEDGIYDGFWDDWKEEMKGNL